MTLTLNRTKEYFAYHSSVRGCTVMPSLVTKGSAGRSEDNFFTKL